MATVTPLNEEWIINEELANKFVELNKFEPVTFDDINDLLLSDSEREELAVNILNSFKCK